LFPIRQALDRFSLASLLGTSSPVPPIANDPSDLSVSSIDDVLEKTGASRSISKSFDACPSGEVYSRAKKTCITWG